VATRKKHQRTFVGREGILHADNKTKISYDTVIIDLAIVYVTVLVTPSAISKGSPA